MRQAALTLHGLAAEDRRWMLRSLSPWQLAAVEPLLQELRELGIPQEAATIARDRSRRAAPAGPRDEQEEMDSSKLPSLALILRNEPASLTAVFLSQQPLPWRERLLAALGPAYAEQVQRLEPAATQPALQTAVLLAIQKRVKGTAYPTIQRTPLQRWTDGIFARRSA
jgi:hypothetical protein